MQESKEFYINIKDLNGFKWYCFDGKLHHFQKKAEDKKGYYVIKCTEEQIHNGDIQVMCKHGWTK